MNKRLLSLMMCSMFVVSGCLGFGDNDEPESEPVEIEPEWMVFYVESSDDLPSCNSDALGRLYHVESEDAFQVCKKTGWSFIDVTGEDGLPGIAGLDGANGKSAVVQLIAESAGTNCAAGGTLAQSGIDADNDGNLDADEITQQAFVCSGIAGSAGEDGNDGSDGSDGSNGSDGEDGLAGVNGSHGLNSMVNTLSESAGVNCQAGGLKITSGVDVNGNGTLDQAEEELVSYVCNGLDGSNGQGFNSLIEVVSVNSNNSNCSISGQKVSTGLDSNSDSVLQPNEVAAVVEICDGSPGPTGATGSTGLPGNDGTNGTDGLDGTNGTDGLDGTNGTVGGTGPAGANGSDGHSAVVSSTAESAGANCANGGVKIQVGIDDNDNGILDAVEVDQTRYICDGGSSANSMLMTQGTPPASQCQEGRFIATGLDNGNGGGTAANGVLESGEIDSKTTWCRNWVVEKLIDDTRVYDMIEFGDKIIFTSGVYQEKMLSYFDSGSGGSGYLLGSTNQRYSYDFDVAVIGNELHVIYSYCSWYWSFTWRYENKWQHLVVNESMEVQILASNTRSTSSSCYMDNYHRGFTESNGYLFYEWNNGSGYELWKIKDAASGPSMVKDINPGSDSSHPDGGKIVFKDELYFSANNSVNGFELWKTDGSEQGTVLVKNLNSNGDGSPSNFQVFDGYLYFSGTDSYGAELWKSNGTSAGTSRLKDINIGTGSSSPMELTESGGELFFSARNTSGRELWKTDGTTIGTEMVKDLYIGTSSSSPSSFFVFEDILYFTANNNVVGHELYRSNGTSSGTYLISNTYGIGNQFAVFESEIYFSADSYFGWELWKTDGTALGTGLVLDLAAGNPDSFATPYFVDGDDLLISASEGGSYHVFKVTLHERVSFN